MSWELAELSRHKKLLFAIVVIAVVVVFWMFGLLRPDYVVIGAYIFAIVVLICFKRREFFYYLMIASAVSVVWILIGQEEYGYNFNASAIGSFNLYPMFAWATGLFAVYVFYLYLEHLWIKKKSFLKQLGLFVLLYWPLLIAGETIAYHVFNIHNDATAIYQGLPICDCLHAPPWMQISYFLIGPIFFLLCYLADKK